MKKFLICLLTVLLALTMFGCSGKEEGGNNDNTKPNDNNKKGNELSNVTLEVAINYTGDSLTAFEKICSAFEAKTGCTIILDTYGSDYATMMTTRMAANNMPDVFVTAGWSLRKYKEYSLDLRDEPYCSDYNDSALGVIKDTDGSIYVCMLSCGVNGNVVNLAVCEAAGVDPYAIHTWDDFLDACEKVKEAGFTPIASNPDAGLTSNLAGTFLTYKNEVADVGAKLLDGTWDWEEYRYLCKFYQKALQNGYFFTDARTINTNDMYERFAQGKAAFIIGENTASIATCYTLNPNGSFAFAPFYGSQEGGEEAVVVGEGDAFSISNKSKNIDAAKVFLQYLATDEVTFKLLDATSRISCQLSVMDNDTTPGTVAFRKMQEDYAGHNIGYYNIWDRDYLPSGMFGILGNAAGKLFANYSDKGIDDVIEYCRTNFKRLYTGK